MIMEGLGPVHLGRAAGAGRVCVDHSDQPRALMRRVVPRMMRPEISETDDADLDWLSRLRHALLPHPKTALTNPCRTLDKALPNHA